LAAGDGCTDHGAGGHGARLPLCQLREEDVSAHPGLANLLLGLTPYLDPSGLSTPLARQLEQAGKELQLRRAAWLRWEALHRLLQEVLIEQRAGRGDANSAGERAFVCMLLDHGGRDMQGGEGGVSSGPLCPQTERGRRRALSMLWTLAEGLGSGQRRLQRPRSRRREAAGGSWRGSEPARYPRGSALMGRGPGLLGGCGSTVTPSASGPAEVGGQLWGGSGLAVSRRLEELNVLLDTYSPERVEVHRAIRYGGVWEGVQQQEQELATAQKILATYESLGPEFEGLVQEYAQLCGGIENKRWALHEFNKGSH
uniref:HAUS augmin like complex subunit 4 n=1 Tax=Chelonoidis abingdonii TaxID=106734 RepID=A0A8C0GZJ5_CHEAB